MIMIMWPEQWPFFLVFAPDLYLFVASAFFGNMDQSRGVSQLKQETKIQFVQLVVNEYCTFWK